MKKLLSFFLITALLLTGLFSVTAAALSGPEVGTDGIYTFEVRGREAYITSVDKSKASGRIIVPETLCGLPVAQIESEVFKDCTEITSVTIKGPVYMIGYAAFEGCTSLVSVSLPKETFSLGTNCFKDCSSLTTINIGGMFSDISSGCFMNCVSLETVKWPYYFNTIGDYAFSGCTNLRSIGPLYCLDSIGEFAFENCKKLNKVTYSAYATSYSATTFMGCDAISLYFPPENKNLCIENGIVYNSSKTKIFYYPQGKKAEEYIAPEKLIYVEPYAFYANPHLKKVTLSEKTKEIGRNAFGYCTALSEIAFPESLTILRDSAFKGCTSLSTAVLGEKLTVLEKAAFSGCSALSRVEIKGKVTALAANVFEGCSLIEELTIPESVSYVGDGAFRGCTGLKSLRIENPEMYIEYNAFDKNSNVSDIWFNGTAEQMERLQREAENYNLSKAKWHTLREETSAEETGEQEKGKTDPSFLEKYGLPIIVVSLVLLSATALILWAVLKRKNS